jgi:putative DNA primase/helicase
MTTVNDVLAQMAAVLPSLPPTPLDTAGKFRKFGKGKKSWYKLFEVMLDDGRCVVTGAFGRWQGRDPGTVKVEVDWSGVSEAELASIKRKQEEKEREEEARRRRVADLASGRARRQWRQARPANEADAHPYLVRKQVSGEFARVDDTGHLLIPARRYAHGSSELACVQKIDALGEKKFNAGADTVGVSCMLGTIPAGTGQIGLAEGYASGQSVRMSVEGALPLMSAFSAGNLLHVARQLRRDFPEAELIFFADDDWQLVPRYERDVQAEFGVAAPPIDGADHVLSNEAGDTVTVRATWRKDATGTDYIEADVRSGRRFQIWKFENAGIASARAAAREVGNARVVWPKFAARGAEKWTDFNDLHVHESLEVVRQQVLAALRAPGADEPGAEPTPDRYSAPEAQAPAPPAQPEPASLSAPTLEVLLSHFALIYPTTDVWDGLRKQRLKKSAFTAWVGKELAAKWEKAEARRTVMRESLPTLVGGRAVEGGGAGGKLGEMLEHLTLLRGTETVWDGIGQQVMSLGAVRADYTSELTAKWQEHALRKTIEAKNLVFDPTQTADPVTHVNIFLGWPLVPKPNPELVSPILALLESLCSAEDQVEDCVHWILRWLAYPLQHPGAKMQTALLMFGEKQGTGKSLFFQDVIAPIYGDYGTVASQHQLDSTFTAWRSRKLFVLFEEVLSRDDKYSHNGTLKYMVTGKHMSINQKNLPERTERNHMNAAFLSNEPQPIPIELEDRRFMVIEARAKQSEEFYRWVKEAIDAGAVEAFYHYLLNLPLDGFDEHTKPIMTLAKERVIEFGLSGWMSFHRAWKDGYLEAPYCSCLSEDLYRIYRRWCDKSGEKALTLCKFAGLIASREHKVKRKVSVNKKQPKSRMVFEIGSPDKAKLEEEIDEFRKVADVRAE